MRLIPPLLSAVLIAIFPARTYADAILTDDATFYGAVVSVSSAGITYRDGCGTTGNASQLPWSQVDFVQFDAQCTAHPANLPVAGLTSCGSQPRLTVYKVRFLRSKDVIYASAVSVNAAGNVRLVLARSGGTLSGDRSGVGMASIQKSGVCQQAIPNNQSWPMSFCYDPAQYAVDWSPVPVSSNQIFTHGSSLFVRSDGAFSISNPDVEVAFQTALSLWASSLLSRQRLLDARLRSYLIASTSTSAHYSLFSPPQVVLVGCPENALMIVDVVNQDSEPFGPQKRDFVALSQLQGRTVLLNAHDFRFGYGGLMRRVASGLINLTSVFVHELGHSFGLPDRLGGKSVMNPDYVTADPTQIMEPTDIDARDFEAVLRESITGSAAGYFRADDCRGLTFRHSASARPTPAPL